MKNIRISAWIILASVITFSQMCTTKKTPKRIVVQYETTLIPDSLKNVIEDVVHNYDQMYHLTYDTFIICDTVLKIVTNDVGSLSAVNAITNGNVINIARTESEFLTKKFIRDLIAHELFHSLKPKAPYFLKKPIETGWEPPFAKFILCSGLNLSYDSTVVGGLPLFEEAAAEVAAGNLYFDFEPSEDYWPVGSLLVTIMDSTKLTMDDVFSAAKANNFELIVSKIFDKPIENLRNDDYMFLINAFIYHKRHEDADPLMFPGELKKFLEGN